MSRLQGWTAFDGLPGPDQVGANAQEQTGGTPQPPPNQMALQTQQGGQRYSPLAQMTSSTLNSMGSPGNIRMQLSPACPPRATPIHEEAFLKPVAENKDPNPSQQIQQQQQQQQPHSQQPSAPQSPPQQQRPIGPAMGAYQMNEMPQSPGDLMRNEYTHAPIRSSPQHMGTPQAPSSSPQIPNNLAGMPGFQSIHALHGFGVQYQNGDVHGLRFSRPSSGSPSPISNPSPFHNHQQQYVMHNTGTDEVADLLAASHLDSSTAAGRMQVRGTDPLPQQQIFAHEYMEGQQGQVVLQGQSERGPGWQYPEVPPKGYKTVICKFWENNMCTKGSGCTFAHGTEDLKRFAGSGPAYRTSGPQDDQALRAYVDEFQLQQMMQMQGMAGGMQGMQGVMPQLSGLPLMPQQGMPQQGMQGQVGMQQQSMQGMSMQGMHVLQSMQSQPGLQSMQGFGGMDDGNVHERLLAVDKEQDIDQQQQMAAMKYFEPQGQMNSLQQQAQARVNLQQQQRDQQQQQQKHMQQFVQQGMMMQQAGRGNGAGPGQNQGGLPPSVLAYRPVNLWPHGPSWQPEEQ